MAKFKEIISDKKFLFLIYGILIVLYGLGFESKAYIPFYFAFAFYIGWLWFFREEERKEKLKLSAWLIIIPPIIILASRIILFTVPENPWGYDKRFIKRQ